MQVLLIAGLVFGAAMLEGFLEMEAGCFQITCFLKHHAQIAMGIAIFRGKHQGLSVVLLRLFGAPHQISGQTCLVLDRREIGVKPKSFPTCLVGFGMFAGPPQKLGKIAHGHGMFFAIDASQHLLPAILHCRGLELQVEPLLVDHVANDGQGQLSMGFNGRVHMI